MIGGFRRLERYFVMGALFSGVMNICLVFYVTNRHLVLIDDSNVPLTLSELPDEGPTVILKKSNFGNDFYIEVYRKNDIVSAALEGGYGDWESNRINSLASIYKDYSREHNIPLQELTFVDIGANIGWYSLSMAALGVNVVAFEPMKENLTLLKHTLSLASNRLIASRITLYEHGLGKSNDRCFIYSDMGNIGDGHVQCKPKESDIVMEDNYKMRGKVDIKRLDDVVQHDDKLSRGRILAVKMDAEGNEGNIFDGGTKFFLQSNVDVILTEFVPDHIIEKGSDPVNFMTQFSNAGYTAKSFSFDMEYMDSKQMIDMSNFGMDMVTLHSASFKNKTLTEIKASSKYYDMNQGNDTMGDDVVFGNQFKDHYDWHEPDSVYYENNSTNPTVKTFNKDTQFAIEVYPSNDIVSNAIKNGYGGWESDTVNALNSIYQEYSQKHNIPLANLTFMDIGANIGWLSLNMAALGVQVIAFEPMKENVERFQSTLKKKMNVEKGISDKIKLYTHGLGVKDETCYLYSDDLNVGDGHTKCVEKESDLDIPANYTLREKVEVRKLDDVLVNPESLHIVAVKMDCEGCEGNVLEGGKKVLLGGSVDAIFTEFEPKWLTEKGSDPKRFMKTFADAGYRVKKQEGKWGYMKKDAMMNMTTFGVGFGDVTFHSPSLVQEFIGGL